ELALPSEVDEWGWSIFYGRPSANVDTWRMLYERGAASEGSAGAAQVQVFGDAPSNDPSVPTRRRAEVERKRPSEVARAPGRMREIRADQEAWWQEALANLSEHPPRARDLFTQALERFAYADRCHISVSLLATAAMTELVTRSEALGFAGDANALMLGYPEMEEFETTAALWEVSRGRATLENFLARHGFHGSQEGEVASTSWREQPEPVAALARSYTRLSENDDPRRREAAAVRTREALEERLFEAVDDSERPALQQALKRAATFVPLRESGRASLSLALDVMRASARQLGEAAVRNGHLEAPNDAFLLTAPELLELPPDLRARADERRALRAHYATFDLPETWKGMPEKIAQEEGRAAGPRLAAGSRLAGLGASAGVHEGRARVVLDPARLEEDFAPGEILVAAATDPSWAPLFLLAGAVVIDTGSNISHAALVAREMGIPAVVSAGDASRRLRDGQRLRVDGASGSVEVLD
ncbi:MAG: PEP-utilizing enzyme, partial [Myxococcota bacterium]